MIKTNRISNINYLAERRTDGCGTCLGKDVIGEAVMTGAEPHSAGFRTEKESGECMEFCMRYFSKLWTLDKFGKINNYPRLTCIFEYV